MIIKVNVNGQTITTRTTHLVETRKNKTEHRNDNGLAQA